MKKRTLGLILVLALAAIVIAQLSGMSKPKNFAECLLKNLPGPASEISSKASINLCADEHPGRLDSASRGTGIGGLTGYKNKFECMADKARLVRNKSAENAIGRACQHLYDKPSIKQTIPDKKAAQRHSRKKWSEVVSDERFLSLSPEDQERGRQLYFNDVVLPYVPEGTEQAARDLFDQDTKGSISSGPREKYQNKATN